MAQSNWEADKMLDVYIYDYLRKRNLQASAKAFMTEGKVAAEPVAIDAPGGFLFEWWSVFWDIFIARTNEKHSEVAAAYIEAQQMKAREHQQQQQQQQQMQMQQLLLQQRQAQLQRRDASHPSLNGPINNVSSDGIGGPNASILAAKMYEERMKSSHSMDSETSPQLLDPGRMALLKTATNHPSQLVQGSPGSVSAALQQIQDIKSEVNLGTPQRSGSMDPTSVYGPGAMQAKSGIGPTGLNQGVSGLPLKGWPLTGFDSLRPTLGTQVQKPFLPTQNQFQLLSQQQQQQILAQAHVQGNLSNSASFGEMDPRRFRVSPRGVLNGKDVQSSVNDGSIGSPIQSNSPKVRQDQAEYQMKMQHSPSAQQIQDQLQQQQLQQNNRKRKQPTSSGPANSTGTGNTIGPSNSPPSTPSTHTPGDTPAMAGNLPHAAISKGLRIYGSDGPVGLASSSTQLDDIGHFPDVGSLDDNVDSFLSNDDGDGRDIFAALKTVEHNTGSAKGFTLNEVSCIHTSSSKVVCCHFSSDGKLLASAGHEKKAVIWNTDTLQTEKTPDLHTLIITDVRFRPNSTQLATSSFDRTVRLWDAADPRICLNTFTGHNSHVMSLDFHPKQTDVFCSSDGNGEIRFWNANTYACSRVSKGGCAQVRFQPRVGHLLAAAADTLVSIFDVDSDRQTLQLKGHTTEVHSVCWDATGDYLASVSQDIVRVWSITSGDCIQELKSTGNKFHSCVFHPTSSSLLIIGGYETLELWDRSMNKSSFVPAHENLIAALAQSPATGMIASASHDKSVKLWK